MKRKRRPARVPGINLTIDPATVGTLYHGGAYDLVVGDLILPQSETGVERAGKRYGGRSRADRVYLTTDLSAARVYAFLRGEGDVYEAEAIAPLEPDPDAKRPGYSFQTARARVVRVVGRRQKMEGGLSPLEAANYVLDGRRRP